jgi:Divergent InlB B-repeat domain
MGVRARARWAGSTMGVLALVLASAGAASSGTASSFAAPNATLDQSNPSRASACRYLGWAPDSANEWVGETFTAGVTGSLTDVVLWVRVSNPRNPVAIVPVDTGGRPVVSTPLASSVLAVEAGPIRDIDISFPAPARVEVGKQYAVVLYAPASDAWAWQADLGSSLTDPLGNRCANGAYTGGRPWLSNNAEMFADGDFFFQTYVVPAKRVTVQKVGTGTGLVQDGTHAIDCGSACSGEYLQGQTVTLTATPDSGSIFSGWSGGACTGTGPTCSVPVNGDVPVTAAFTRQLVTLKVAKVGFGAVRSLPPGITCGGGCSHSFVPGPVTLTAKPSKGWRFARWQGACRGTRPGCRLVLTRTSTVAAIFART